jgi:hypothetical protein
MAKLRVYKAQVISPPTLRVFQAEFSGSSPSAYKLRVYKASFTGTSPTTPKLRVRKIQLAAQLTAILNPIANRTVEPRLTCTTTASPAEGSATPDSYTWRQISGPAVTLTGSGATRSFLTPNTMPPNSSTIVLGVLGVLSGTNGPEVTSTIEVPPQTSWTWNGSAWVGGGVKKVP